MRKRGPLLLRLWANLWGPPWGDRRSGRWLLYSGDAGTEGNRENRYPAHESPLFHGFSSLGQRDFPYGAPSIRTSGEKHVHPHGDRQTTPAVFRGRGAAKPYRARILLCGPTKQLPLANGV